jgi:hypothetical protein
MTHLHAGESFFCGGGDSLTAEIFPNPAAASDVPETDPAQMAESAPEARFASTQFEIIKWVLQAKVDKAKQKFLERLVVTWRA